MNQTATVLATEANAWFDRNRNKIGTPEAIRGDLLLKIIDDNGIKPTSVLEVGCANGWRLEELRKRYGCQCIGVDPSFAAMADGMSKHPDISLYSGMAHFLSFPDNHFDLVLYGFCLYLSAPKWLFMVASEGDRVLRNNGYLGILDFHANTPHSVRYHHDPSMRSYKMDYANLWVWNPAYEPAKVFNIASKDMELQASLLHKESALAFPLKEQA